MLTYADVCGLMLQGLVESVEQRRISETEARTAVEVFLTGGDTHVYAVTHWDDQPVGYFPERVCGDGGGGGVGVGVGVSGCGCVWEWGEEGGGNRSGWG
jgi:hypothetical protein